MQQITIVGNLTNEPELRTTPNGKTVCNFTVAVNRRRKVEGQPEADFFRVAAWGKSGENCQKYLAKGRKVCVTGTVSARAYMAQDGNPRASLEVLADDVEFLSPKGTGGEAPANEYTPVDDNDLPWGVS